jgi:hypothetical protein
MIDSIWGYIPLFGFLVLVVVIAYGLLSRRRLSRSEKTTQNAAIRDEYDSKR